MNVINFVRAFLFYRSEKRLMQSTTKDTDFSYILNAFFPQS